MLIMRLKHLVLWIFLHFYLVRLLAGGFAAKIHIFF